MRLSYGSRKVVALVVLSALAGVAWFTMDAGSIRWLVIVLLGGFALRIALMPARTDEASDASSEGRR